MENLRKGIKKFLWKPLFYVVLTFGIVVVITNYTVLADSPSQEVQTFVYMAMFVYTCLFYLVPILVLFYNHKKHSRGKKLAKNGHQIICTFKENKYTFPDDFVEIEQFQTNSKYHSRFDWSLWGEYGYYLLTTKNGSQMYCSNLLLEGLHETLHTFNVSRKVKGFPMLKRDKIP